MNSFAPTWDHGIFLSDVSFNDTTYGDHIDIDMDMDMDHPGFDIDMLTLG